jgi:hypothetical protein
MYYVSPFAPFPLQELHHYYELIRNPLCFDTLGLSSSDCAFSLNITGGSSPVPFISQFAKSRHLYTGCPMANMKAPAIVIS